MSSGIWDIIRILRLKGVSSPNMSSAPSPNKFKCLHFLNVFKEYRNLKDWLSQGSLFCHFAGDSASGFMEVKNELIGCMKVKNGLIGRIFTINSMVHINGRMVQTKKKHRSNIIRLFGQPSDNPGAGRPESLRSLAKPAPGLSEG